MKLILFSLSMLLLTGCAQLLPNLIGAVDEAVIQEAESVQAEMQQEARMK